MGGQRQTLRKKPRANFTGRWVRTGGENLAPTQSVAMPHQLGYPEPKHTKYGLQENVLSGTFCVIPIAK
jgi:hypothetical protein